MEGMFDRMIQEAKRDLISEMAALETVRCELCCEWITRYLVTSKSLLLFSQRLYEHNLTAREIDEESLGRKQGQPTFPMRRSLVRT